ncbi:MAG: transporter substrate-binding domain-containing protein [Clostridia bacterium]|nr:transporter substrate-binding domain-containing protein [Clostridia bacterium]
MKKIVTLVLVFAMLFTMATCFTSCGEQSDWEKVKEQGFFRCGITYYAPMNYFDENDTLVGFDTEFAEAVAKYLGVEVKFQVISWPNKYLELNNGSIDLIWNGFTYGNESDGVSRTEYVDFTHSYLENKQVVVTLTSRLNELNSADALKGKTAAVEGGSSGESVAVDFAGSEDKVAKFAAQSNALLEVKSGTAAFAVIDYQMAKAMVGTGDYKDLSINEAFDLGSEVYAIGARKGSDLTAKINEAIVALSKDGTLKTIADKYGLTNDLIPNIGEAK